MDKLKYLVLDEADRMVEATHYQDMWNILECLRAGGGGTQAFGVLCHIHGLQEDDGAAKEESQGCL